MKDAPDFDIYPDLDRQVEAAARERQSSEPPPSLGEVVAKEVYGGGDNEPYSREELEEWAIPSLKAALGSWKRLESSSPASEKAPFEKLKSNLADNDPRLMANLARLHEINDRLTIHGPEGLKGDTGLDIVLVPWEAMFTNLNSLLLWLSEKRAMQDLNLDIITDLVQPFIKKDKPWYRDPDNPANLLTSAQYLAQKIEKDGPIGLMLMQTKRLAIDKPNVYKSPDDLTSSGSRHWTVQDSEDPKRSYDLDALGYFEWLALTLQVDELSEHEEASWLLANRVPNIPGYKADPTVPAGVIISDKTMKKPRTALVSLEDPQRTGAFQIRIAIA